MTQGRNAMQKWEYCVIDGFQGGMTYYPRCYRLTDKGFEFVSDFKDRPKDVSEQDAVGRFIAQLGDEGWEMVGAGVTGDFMHRVYFKRPKS